MSNGSTKEKSQRSHIRLNRRVLLLAFVSVIIVLSVIYAKIVYQYRSQVAPLEAIGGQIAYDYQFNDDFDAFVYDGWRNQGFKPVWLRKFLGEYVFHDVVGVFDVNNTFTDEDTRLLKQIRDLRVLDLGNQVTDDCVDTVIELKSLERLKLTHTQISPHGIQRLREALPETEIIVIANDPEMNK